MRRQTPPPDPGWLVPAIVAIMLVALGYWLFWSSRAPAPQRPQAAAPARQPGAGEYLFCHWNVENFYDDNDDPRNHDADEDFFAEHPDLVREKAAHLAEALLLQNDRHGPDIIALVEVESRRSMELLQQALNDQLPTDWQYTTIAQRDYLSDRRLAPAILTRLLVDDRRTRLFPRRRILEVHLEAAGAPLVVLASHWTSRLRGDTESKREGYASALYEEVVRLSDSDPAVDALISGDFNDEPDDPSVREALHATDDAEAVRSSMGTGAIRLLDLMMDVDPTQGGTYYHNGRWEILDHIVAAPGMLDGSGWQVMPGTIKTVHPAELRSGRSHQPWRFGGPTSQNPRGYSDHFAISVRLRVQPRRASP